MRNLLHDKHKYYSQFADTVYGQFRKLRYGIAEGKTKVDPMLSAVRKEIVDYQGLEDNDAFTDVSYQYMGWLPVFYEPNDETTQFTLPQNNYSNYQICQRPAGSVGINFGYGTNQSQNILQVNSGGCITRINLNPVINISTVVQGSKFVFTQEIPATEWLIIHNLGMIPNLFIQDTNGSEVEGDITIIDQNKLKINFNQPVAGSAYLS